ncbi:hypothetical protein KVT40_008933 [Elsinoe batatas]|uniref:Uncharacterized protein n=1 Tax=Elsinoe batatas TaxID=2601811 RepID=A0A8K0PCV7_9PEZI|nr:hypothetical protein KVT40_008933 [Elsinoe batatas]
MASPKPLLSDYSAGDGRRLAATGVGVRRKRVERLQVTKSIRKSLCEYRITRELVSSACFNRYFVACFGLRKFESVQRLNFSRGEEAVDNGGHESFRRRKKRDLDLDLIFHSPTDQTRLMGTKGIFGTAQCR